MHDLNSCYLGLILGFKSFISWGNFMQKRSMAALVLASTLLAGCSTSDTKMEVQSPTESSEGAAPATPASNSLTSSAPTHPEAEFDYGEIVGTLQVDVENADGYTAVMDIAVHKVTVLEQAGNLGPSCMVNLDVSTNEDLSVTDANSLLIQAVTYTVTLGDHSGFPEPTDFAPTLGTSLQSNEIDWAGDAECSTYSTGSEPIALTSEGYEGMDVDLSYGRSTPANPLPTSIDEIEFTGSPYYVDVFGGSMCNVRPSGDFVFHAQDNPQFNDPDRNNGYCSFSFSPSQ